LSSLKCRERDSAVIGELVTVCLGHFVNQAVSAKQANLAGDFAGLSLGRLGIGRFAIEQDAEVTVSEPLDRELAAVDGR
jgi:hypothetical protein